MKQKEHLLSGLVSSSSSVWYGDTEELLQLSESIHNQIMKIQSVTHSYLSALTSSSSIIIFLTIHVASRRRSVKFNFTMFVKLPDI